MPLYLIEGCFIMYITELFSQYCIHRRIIRCDESFVDTLVVFLRLLGWLILT